MKTIICCAMLFICSTTLKAQEKAEAKFRTFFDVGYFYSSWFLATNGGNYLSAGFGYKINKEFWLNLTIIKVTGTGEFEQSPFFINNKTIYNNTLIVPNFSKDWKISNKFYISGAIGAALIFENVQVPFVKIDSSNNFTGIYFENQGESFNIGLFGEIVMKYEIIENLNLTLNTKSFLPMNLEPDSFMIGAGIEIKL